MATGEQEQGTENDGEERGPLDSLQPSEVSRSHGQALRACPFCEDGVLWEDEDTDEAVCDNCYRATASTDRRQQLPMDLGPSLEDVRERPHTADGTHERRSRTPLFGGYTRAYLSFVTDDEYAIDAYDDVTDGLWTPHNRG